MASRTRTNWLVLALTFALALYGARGNPGPLSIVLLSAGIAICLLYELSDWALRKSLSSAEKIGRMLLLIVVTCAGAAWYGWQFWPRPIEPSPPPPPTLTSLVLSDDVPLNYSAKRLVVSQKPTPCTMKHRRSYSFDELGSQPGGPKLGRTWLVAKPLRLFFENRVLPHNPQASTPADSADLLFEISVTSRGQPTVAKDWRLCLVSQGNPVYYKPQEILPSDLEPFQNRVLLEQATIAAPIERGHAVDGWIMFRVPKDVA
jgi:hypothetical protein